MNAANQSKEPGSGVFLASTPYGHIVRSWEEGAPFLGRALARGGECTEGLRSDSPLRIWLVTLFLTWIQIAYEIVNRSTHEDIKPVTAPERAEHEIHASPHIRRTRLRGRMASGLWRVAFNPT